MKKSSADKQPGKGNLEEVFRHGLGQGEVTPGADLWSRIDQQLDQQQQVGKYKRRAGYLALLSALLLMLIGGLALYNFLPEFSGSGAITDVANSPASQQQTQAPKTNSAEQQSPETGPSDTKTDTNTRNSTAVNQSESDNQHIADRAATNTNQATLSETGSTANNNNQSITGNQNKQNLAIVATAGTVKSGKKKNTIRKEVTAPATGAIAYQNTKAARPENKAVANQTSDGKNAVTRTSATKNTTTQPASGKGNDKANAAVPPVNSSAFKFPIPREDGNAVAVGTEVNSKTLTENNNQAADTENQATSEQTQPEGQSKTDSLKQELALTVPATDSAAVATTDAPEKGKHGWVISASYAGYQFEQGLVVSPAVPVTTLPVHNTDVTRYEQAAAEFNDLTKSAKSYRVELRAGYWLHNRWRIEAGLSYAKNKAVTQSTYVIQSFVRDASGTMQMAEESSVLEPAVNNIQRDSVAVSQGPGYETTYQYQFLAVPVRVVYQSDTDAWHWFASGGISGGMLLGSTIVSSRANSKQHQLHESAFRKWQASGLFSFGLGYQVTDRFCLQAGPDLSYSVNSLMGSKKTGVKQKNPYTIGLSGGVSFTLK